MSIYKSLALELLDFPLIRRRFISITINLKLIVYCSNDYIIVKGIFISFDVVPRIVYKEGSIFNDFIEKP